MLIINHLKSKEYSPLVIINLNRVCETVWNCSSHDFTENISNLLVDLLVDLSNDIFLWVLKHELFLMFTITTASVIKFKEITAANSVAWVTVNFMLSFHIKEVRATCPTFREEFSLGLTVLLAFKLLLHDVTWQRKCLSIMSSSCCHWWLTCVSYSISWRIGGKDLDWHNSCLECLLYSNNMSSRGHHMHFSFTAPFINKASRSDAAHIIPFILEVFIITMRLHIVDVPSIRDATHIHLMSLSFILWWTHAHLLNRTKEMAVFNLLSL